MARVATLIRSQDQPTIDSLLEGLVTSGLLEGNHVQQSFNAHRQIVFFAVGSITSLFTPEMPDQGTQDLCFRIRAERTKIFTSMSLPIQIAERPLSELIQAMGTSLTPTKRSRQAVHDSLDLSVAHLAQCFSVSHLNGNVLRSVGGISVEWVDSISAHLDFDVVHKRLFLFRSPSFCEVSCSQDSAVARVLESLYDEWTRPHGFSAPAFLREIMLSTRLIFGDSKGGRCMYQRHEKTRAEQWGVRDHLLDQLCGLARANVGSTQPIPDPMTESYEKDEFFPLLTPRLEALQKYMIRQHPNRWKALWADKRDLTRWYTLWAVAIFGSIGVLLSVIQCALSAVQIAVAYRTLALSAV
ncbi:hypothetical protein G647_09204 [Cladophialophora carrionii CBS 160.54]|uniref:Uncharacterized protein n=1 Tax=Cladophialophora carrionii CBS 160.54 TaxID=1279043 RepID=V9D098_9EURO|nr:uncharacterized protein G647_09204 [Cladophialophora carrionii CBS 160.54]ETI19372.1 hypothetical protein G647_09204 [Cladophialophora carrionii CBS 160.54]